jgi:hypothetical protein
MSPRWAIAVVRIERLDDGADAASSRLLVRVQVGLDDEAPHVLSVRAADAQEARELVGTAIDGIYAALFDSSVSAGTPPAKGPGPLEHGP